jgi:ketosteroid isomerase-like protein
MQRQQLTIRPFRPPKATRKETAMQVTQLSDAAQRTLATWHELLARNAMEELDALLSDDIVFRSPVAHTPYPGKAAIKLVLKTVNTVFQNFLYHRSFVSEDGRSIVLEFSAEVSGKALKGIDMLRFDDQGRIEEFEVMVRPMSGLQALAAQMAAQLAPAYATLTGKDAAA